MPGQSKSGQKHLHLLWCLCCASSKMIRRCPRYDHACRQMGAISIVPRSIRRSVCSAPIMACSASSVVVSRSTFSFQVPGKNLSFLPASSGGTCDNDFLQHPTFQRCHHRRRRPNASAHCQFRLGPMPSLAMSLATNRLNVTALTVILHTRTGCPFASRIQSLSVHIAKSIPGITTFRHLHR